METMESLEKKVVGNLCSQLGVKSPMHAPRLVKIVLNMGVGEASRDKEALSEAIQDMTLISGQKPIVTKARKSIAGFNIRDGWPVGCMATLRRARMREFFYRLLNIAIPRTRDFRGFARKGFDGHGNYSFGIREQIVFPEIDYDRLSHLRGLDVTVVTSTKRDDWGEALLKAYGFPFVREG